MFDFENDILMDDPLFSCDLMNTEEEILEESCIIQTTFKRDIIKENRKGLLERLNNLESEATKQNIEVGVSLMEQ